MNVFREPAKKPSPKKRQTPAKEKKDAAKASMYASEVEQPVVKKEKTSVSFYNYV